MRIVESRAMTGQGAIDVHAHFFPAAFVDVIEEAGAPFGARVDRADARGPAILVGANRTPPPESRYYDLDPRPRSMDRQGVALPALSLTTPMVYWADGEVGRPPARALHHGA